MIAKITPLRRLPSGIDAFDYGIPEELEQDIKKGQLVVIPFGLRKINGVVLDLLESPTTKKRIRPITNILYEKPLLNEHQLTLIKKFSDYYFVSPGSVARMIAPQPLTRKSDSKAEIDAENEIKFNISKNQLYHLRKFVQEHSKHEVMQIQDLSSFLWYVLYTIKDHAFPQIVLLFPRINLIHAFGSVLQKKYPGELSIIHSELGKGAYWNEYQNIKSLKSRILLSTRQGVFLPIHENSLIIFFETGSQDFKQYDQHPKYDARIVAKWVSKNTSSQIIRLSSSPLLSKTKPGKLPSASSDTTNIKLIDMKHKDVHTRPSIISQTTLELIQSTLNNKKKIVVLSLREKSDEGVSVDRIIAHLTKILKNCIISKNTAIFDVLCTTPHALEALKLSSERGNIGLLVFASIEPLLAIPDYRSGERTYQLLMHWKLLSQELKIPQILLQSYSADNPVIQAFANNDFESFKNHELKARHAMNYPPYTQLIKLSYQGGNKTDVQTTLTSLKSKFGAGVQILGPFKNKKQEQSLLLKISKPTNLSILKNLSTDWSIDRDPEQVL
jgi:primosomal protein N'